MTIPMDKNVYMNLRCMGADTTAVHIDVYMRRFFYGVEKMALQGIYPHEWIALRDGVLCMSQFNLVPAHRHHSYANDWFRES